MDNIKKVSAEPKVRPDKYSEKVLVRGTFEDIIKASVKDADKVKKKVVDQ